MITYLRNTPQQFPFLSPLIYSVKDLDQILLTLKYQ